MRPLRIPLPAGLQRRCLARLRPLSHTHFSAPAAGCHALLCGQPVPRRQGALLLQLLPRRRLHRAAAGGAPPPVLPGMKGCMERAGALRAPACRALTLHSVMLACRRCVAGRGGAARRRVCARAAVHDSPLPLRRRAHPQRAGRATRCSQGRCRRYLPRCAARCMQHGVMSRPAHLASPRCPPAPCARLPGADA